MASRRNFTWLPGGAAHSRQGQKKRVRRQKPDAAFTTVIGPSDKPGVKFHVSKLNPTEKVLALMLELGIPKAGAGSCFSVVATGRFWGLKFQKYAVELFGTKVDDVVGLGACNTFEYAEPIGKILIWRRRIFYQGDDFWTHPDIVLSPLEPPRAFAEALWQPKQREKLSVRGLEHASDDQAIALIQCGLPLLRKITTQSLEPGRPKGSRHLKPIDFHLALQETLETFTKPPSQAQLLARLSEHRLWQKKRLSLAEAQTKTKTLRNWLNPPLTWKAVLEMYRNLKSGK